MTDVQTVDYQAPFAIEPFAGMFPIPADRGRWRLTLHARTLSGQGARPTLFNSWRQTVIAELTSARSRRLDQKRNGPAQLSFTMNGRDPACASILEMQHDVMAWRWDDYTGTDVAMFRGPITQSEDQITEQSHVVTFTALDYLAMLQRRVITSLTGVTYTASDQDLIAQQIIADASYQPTLTGAFTVSALLPMWTLPVNPDGTSRGASNVVRDRTYAGGSVRSELLDNLANVINGFEYDIVPNARVPSFQQPAAGGAWGNDAVRIFYPRQGVTRDDFMLVYGGNISTLTRALNSTDYLNYVRVIGNNASSDPAAPQQAFDAFTNNDPQVGVWASNDNGSSDINDSQTIQQRALGAVNNNGVLVPSYTLGIRPNRYRFGSPNMGDTVTLRINSGRLNVNTPIRVVGLAYAIGDDGQEDVEVTVGRPAASFNKAFQTIGKNINALSRR